MANLQTISNCDRGIVLNTTTAYTMVRLPQGIYTNTGFSQPGSVFYDTNRSSIVVINGSNQGYTVDMVNFIDLG
jgi:hypothetical protein